MSQLSLFGDEQPTKQDKPIAPKSEQTRMFADKELMQFGVKANPTMPIPENCTAHLALEIQDVRTDEQKATDLRHDAESLTVPLPDHEWTDEEFDQAEEILFPDGCVSQDFDFDLDWLEAYDISMADREQDIPDYDNPAPDFVPGYHGTPSDSTDWCAMDFEPSPDGCPTSYAHAKRDSVSLWSWWGCILATPVINGLDPFYPVPDPTIPDERTRVLRALSTIRANLIKNGQLDQWTFDCIVKYRKSEQIRVVLEKGDYTHWVIVFLNGELSNYWAGWFNLHEFQTEWIELSEYSGLWDLLSQDYWPDCDTDYPERDTQVIYPLICPICGQHISEGLTQQDGRAYHWNCYARLVDYQDRVEKRLARLQRSADRAEREYQQTSDRAHKMAEAIPFGQPVMGVRDRNYRDRIWKTQDRAMEHYKRAERLQRRAEAAQDNRAISSDDPAAIIKLEEKLAKLEALQVEMIRVNKAVQKVIRKPRVPKAEREQLNKVLWQGCSTLAEMNARGNARLQERLDREAEYPQHAPDLAKLLGCTEERALQYLTPDMLGRIGFPNYALTNNTAQIRRIKDRIETLKRQRIEAATQENTSQDFGAIRLIKNVELNRVQIEFPGKPSKEIITELKSHGFKWAPSQGCWQRQLNASAEWWAKQIINKARA